MTPAPAVETAGVAKRYGRRWALRDCSLSIPEGRIAALVGPNGSGKSTLLRMLAGLTPPTSGSIRIFGRERPAQGRELRECVGYLDQDRPLYRGFSVAEMLRFGRETNPTWDDERAHGYLDQLDIPLAARVGALSGGQQAQVALALCLAKRPSLLLLDEPVAALDPMAREDLMHLLLQAAVDDGLTMIISSHVIADLAAVCDFVVILSAATVQLAGDVDDVLAHHRLVVASTGDGVELPPGAEVLSAATAGRQVSRLVRAAAGGGDGAGVAVAAAAMVAGAEVIEPTLEEIVMGYLRRGRRREPAQTVAAGAGGAVP